MIIVQSHSISTTGNHCCSSRHPGSMLPGRKEPFDTPERYGRQTSLFMRRQTPAFDMPTTKFDLVQGLRRLLLSSSSPHFSRLLSWHNRYPHLHSTESYNILIALSIRLNTYSTTRSLLRLMIRHNLYPNEETEKLIVRYNVSAGFWINVWRQVLERYSQPAFIPIPILLELLASNIREYALPRKSTPNKRFRRLQRRGLKLSPELHLVRPPRRLVPLEPLRLLLLRFPDLTVDQLVKISPLLVSYVVRGLLRFNLEDSAVLLTKKHLEGQPPTLTPKRIRFLQDLINLHLSVGEVKLANHKRRRRLVEGLFLMHPQVKPNAKTACLLMRYMARSRRGGIEAYLFYKNFKARWGPTVDSLDVRGRIIKYALKQRKLGIANEIAKLPPITETPEDDVRAENRHGKLIPLRSFRSIYPGEGRSRQKWFRNLVALLIQRRKRRRLWNRKFLILWFLYLVYIAY